MKLLIVGTILMGAMTSVADSDQLSLNYWFNYNNDRMLNSNPPNIHNDLGHLPYQSQDEFWLKLKYQLNQNTSAWLSIMDEGFDDDIELEFESYGVSLNINDNTNLDLGKLLLPLGYLPSYQTLSIGWLEMQGFNLRTNLDEYVSCHLALGINDELYNKYSTAQTGILRLGLDLNPFEHTHLGLALLAGQRGISKNAPQGDVQIFSSMLTGDYASWSYQLNFQHQNLSEGKKLVLGRGYWLTPIDGNRISNLLYWQINSNHINNLELCQFGYYESYDLYESGFIIENVLFKTGLEATLNLIEPISSTIRYDYVNPYSKVTGDSYHSLYGGINYNLANGGVVSMGLVKYFLNSEYYTKYSGIRPVPIDEPYYDDLYWLVTIKLGQPEDLTTYVAKDKTTLDSNP